MIVDENTMPKVSIDFMNRTHLEEVELVNKIAVLIGKIQENTDQNDSSVLTHLLDEWLEHTEAHFARENNLMSEIKFPALSVHAGEHSMALNNMVQVMNEWKQNNDIYVLSNYVFNLWPNWFNAHVQSMDMVTANFALMHGFDPSSLPDE